MTSALWNEFLNKSPTFNEQLDVTLELTIDGTVIKVWGANVKNFELELLSYGFSGCLDFWVNDDVDMDGDSDDALKEPFQTVKLVEVKLEIRVLRPDRKDVDRDPDPLMIQGYVTEKCLYEQANRRGKEAPIAARRYGIRFCDAARFFWEQHFPCELYTKKSMQDVLDAHKGEKIKLVYNSQVLSTQRPLIYVGLERDRVKPASFYDFLMWYVDTHNLLLRYDFKEDQYTIEDEKPQDGEPVAMDFEDAFEFIQRFPNVPRWKPRIHNSYTESPATQPIDNTEVVAPLSQDFLVRTSLTGQVDAKVTLETARLKLPTPEVHLACDRYPGRMIMPWDLIDVTQDPQWDLAAIAVPAIALSKKCRCYRVYVLSRAQSQGQSRREIGSMSEFEIKLYFEFEPIDDKLFRLPTYVTPTYPSFVEGKIVSTIGADDEETYDIETDSETKLDSYKVKVPLWADQIVQAPFEPLRMSGHFYFPAYKNERVMVALELYTARIVGFLDWRVEGRLPKEGQGNHLLTGKKPLSSTSISHVYEDDKPVFTIIRKNEKDHQTIQAKEGYLLIEVKEEQ